ncbi:MAG: hypothetical protein LBJ91_00190 [Clostridiales Family XIII bacterium]|nr:hypothetical protein [Clostridiales Family XIII bacterium]
MSKKRVTKSSKAKVTIPGDLDNFPERHEVDAAWILARHYDCEVSFLKATDSYKIKSPDISINQIPWEIKSPQGKSKYTVRRQLGRASKQSKYIVFDGRRTSLPDNVLVSRIRDEWKERRSIKRIIFINKSAEVLEILR